MVVSASGWGGGERAALTLARALVRAGDQVVIAGRGGGLFEEEARARGLPFHDACPGDGPDLRGMARLVRLIRAERPDVLHAHLNRAALWSGVAAGATSTPLIATAHGMTRAIYYRLAHRVIAVSKAVAAHLLSQVSKLQVAVIPNPLEAPPAAPASEVAALRSTLSRDGERVLLVAAKLHPNKGQRLALDALAHLPGTRLWLAGDGPDQAELQARARRLDVASRVTFLGHRSDVPDLMRAADVLLVPSEAEAFSLVAAESLLCGTPVIAARTGGIPEVVGDDGELVADRDPKVWVQRIQDVCGNLAAARERAARAQQRLLTSCSMELVVAQTRAIYRSLS